MNRLSALFKATVPFVIFGTVWLTAHLLDGSRTLDANEVFNASQGWLAVLSLILLVNAKQLPTPLQASAALVPLTLVYAEAQRLGTWAGVAAGAQWLAFASLGHGLGALASSDEPKPLKRAKLALPVAAAALAAWSLSGLSPWAPIGSAMVFAGTALGVAAPSFTPERRRALTLHGLLAPLCLFLALFLITPVTPMRGRLFACGLAFGFGWLEGRRSS